jgi:hypothetical protein
MAATDGYCKFVVVHEDGRMLERIICCCKTDRQYNIKYNKTVLFPWPKRVGTTNLLKPSGKFTYDQV